MPHDMQPYPAYKNALLPWLGKVPAHWQERRAKYFFSEVDERSQTGEEELLSVSHVTGVTPRSQKTVTMFMAESYAGHKLCRPGDLVINTMWAWMAALGVAKQAGIVSPGYAVYRPAASSALVPAFLDHLLRTQPYASEYLCRSTGIRASRLRLYPDKFLEIPVVCPPTEEQQQILAYLNAKDRLIRRFARNKRRLIDLLNEQKQAIINRAVNRGLEQSIGFKSPGFSGLGDVPERWNVIALRHLGTKFGSGVTPRGGASVYRDSGIPLIRSQNVHFDGLRLADVALISPEIHREMSGTHVRAGDVLLNITGASIGRACAVPSGLGEANVNQHVCIIRPIPARLTPDFLAAFSRSRSFKMKST
jgi:type I restriction enzyme, S subunit